MANGKRRLGWSKMVALLGATVLVHCKEAAPCQATITLSKQAVTGEGPDRQQALKRACTNHCLEHDALVDGKYRVWRAAGGKGAGKRAEAIQSVDALKRYLDACTERCSKEVKDVQYADCGSP